MLDDLRNYLQMASGVTEATTSKAREAVSGLLSHGFALGTRAIPAPEMMGQVQELADDLVTTSRNNREMLVGMIRAEVDRAVGRMGFVREDELAALRRHVQRLEKQIDELSAPAPSAPAAAPVSEPAAEAAPEPAAEAAPEPAAEAAPEPAPETAPEPAAEAPPKRKKKILVVDEQPKGSS